MKSPVDALDRSANLQPAGTFGPGFGDLDRNIARQLRDVERASGDGGGGRSGHEGVGYAENGRAAFRFSFDRLTCAADVQFIVLIVLIVRRPR